MNLKDEILMHEYRGDVLENVHRGHIVIVNYKNEINSVGNPDHFTYMRSTAKPMQILPLLDMGLDKKYNLTEEETTIMAGSQFASEYHVKALESIAKKIDIDENILILKGTYSIDEKNKFEQIRENRRPRKFYHVCAGKHLSLIAIAKELGMNPKDYYKIDSPVQLLVEKYISEITGFNEIKKGIDGCGVPVFAMPLKNMAYGFLNMITQNNIKDQKTSENAKKIVALYNKYCDYVCNRGFLCSEFNRDENIFAKGGADGVYCFALKKEKIAVSFKITDGSEVEWHIVIANILEQLNYENKNTIERIYKLRPKEIVCASGEVCGNYDPVFKLKI